MRKKILIAVTIFSLFLIIIASIIFISIKTIDVTNTNLVHQSEIRSLIDDMIVSMNNSQFVVFMRQSGNMVDNDIIINEVNKFTIALSKLNHKYEFDIDKKNCMSCHVAIDDKMTRSKSTLNSIQNLLENYKTNVSFMFTTRDADIRQKLIQKTGEIGNGIISEVNRIHHIATKMLEQLDIKSRKNYHSINNLNTLSYFIGLLLIALFTIYILYITNKDINRFNKTVNIIAKNNYENNIELDNADKELLPIIESTNSMIEELKKRNKKIDEKDTIIYKLNSHLEEMKQTFEDKVRERTEELKLTNRDLIENQIKHKKTYKELQEKTKELEEKNKRLQELDKMKTEFIQMANHEMRTPLVTIKGYTDLMLANCNKNSSDDRTIKFLNTMQRNLNRLTGTIENIRTLTLLDTDKIKIHITKIDVKELLTNVYNDMVLLTKKRNQNLYLELQTEYPPLICNENHVYQALINFIINSIRYSPDESDIIIKAIFSKNTNEIIFSVKDNGMGIEEKELKNIFLPFYEIKNINEHHSGTIEFNSAGSGLGLTIVKKIVERHGGRIWVESPGLWKGSTFYFSLPLRTILV